jgi:hypothetical protein
MAYIQNHKLPGKIKKVNVSVIHPQTKPNTGPKYQPINITGIYPNEKLSTNPGMGMLIICNTILKANIAANTNISLVEWNILIG